MREVHKKQDTTSYTAVDLLVGNGGLTQGECTKRDLKLELQFNWSLMQRAYPAVFNQLGLV
jgi:hypothetical protein